MRTWQLAALTLLTALCATSRLSAAEQPALERPSPELQRRIALIKERTVALYEVSVSSEGCTSEVRRFARHLLTPTTPEERPEFSIFLGIPSERTTVCTFLRAPNIDLQALRAANRDFERSLRSGTKLEAATTDLFGQFGFTLPEEPAPTVIREVRQPIPLIASAPPRDETASAAAQAAPVEVQAVRKSPASERLIIAAIILIVCILAALAYLLARLSKRQTPSSSSRPSIPPTLSENELLAKWGFGGQDLESMADSGTYERMYREQLFRAGGLLFLLGNLVEAAEERYPDLWRSVSGQIVKARKLLAQEIDKRHLEVAFNRENKPVRERIVNVCRALELASSICKIVFEAYGRELDSRFSAYALIRNFYAQAVEYREKAKSLPPEIGKALLKALDNYDELAEHVTHERVPNWPGAYLGLEALKNRIEKLAEQNESPLPATPELVHHEASTKRLRRSVIPTSTMPQPVTLPTIVPG